jgi:hypothetical protein
VLEREAKPNQVLLHSEQSIAAVDLADESLKL